MKKICVKNDSLVAVLLLLHFLGGCSLITLPFDRFFDPDDIAIDFAEGREIDLKFKVVASCHHDVGIGFSSNAAGSEMDRYQKAVDFFGNISTLSLPAEIDITVVDNKNKTILNKRLEGKVKNWRYGPSPMRFIAEFVYLPAGEYRVKIKVNKCYKDFRGFDAFFFASQNKKLTCAKL